MTTPQKLDTSQLSALLKASASTAAAEQEIQMSDFQTLDDIGDEPTNFLIYGPAKSGKTHLVGTLGARVLVLDTGRGLSVFKNKTFRAQHPEFKPIIFQVRESYTHYGLPEKATAYDRVCRVFDYAIANMLDKFDIAVLDDLTSLRKFATFKGLDINQALRKSQTKVNVLEKWNVLLPAMQDYGTEMSLIEQFVDGYINIFKALGKHFVVTAHERQYFESVKGDDGKPKLAEPKELKKIRPAVTGQTMPDNITMMFDNVFHTEKFGGLYALRTKSLEEMLLADTRFSGLWPNVIPDALEKNPAKIAKWKNGPDLSVMLADIIEAKEKGVIFPEKIATPTLS